MLTDFALPPELAAHEPAEARGLPRDGVRMLVSRRRTCPLGPSRPVSATAAGGAARPRAGRRFPPARVARLVARGVTIAPLALHTGVSSLEGDEEPYPEPYDVPPATARLVNLTRAAGGRGVAAGATVVAALETPAARGAGGAAPAALGAPCVPPAAVSR